MILLHAQLQISRDVFVYGKIIQMRTFNENNYTAIKLSRNGNSKAKNNNEKTIQFTEVVKHN